MGLHGSLPSAQGAAPGTSGWPVSGRVVFLGQAGPRMAEALDRPMGGELLALAWGHLLTEAQKEDEAAAGSRGQAGLQTTGLGHVSRAGFVGAVPAVLTLPLSPSGHICAAGPGLGVCAHLHLLGGESTPGASGWPRLAREPWSGSAERMSSNPGFAHELVCEPTALRGGFVINATNIPMDS